MPCGGFGITYLRYDHNLDKGVAIKEYLPADIAARTGGPGVAPHGPPLSNTASGNSDNASAESTETLSALENNINDIIPGDPKVDTCNIQR